MLYAGDTPVLFLPLLPPVLGMAVALSPAAICSQLLTSAVFSRAHGASQQRMAQHQEHGVSGDSLGIAKEQAVLLQGPASGVSAPKARRKRASLG